MATVLLKYHRTGKAGTDRHFQGSTPSSHRQESIEFSRNETTE